MLQTPLSFQVWAVVATQNPKPFAESAQC